MFMTRFGGVGLRITNGVGEGLNSLSSFQFNEYRNENGDIEMHILLLLLFMCRTPFFYALTSPSINRVKSRSDYVTMTAP